MGACGNWKGGCCKKGFMDGVTDATRMNIPVMNSLMTKTRKTGMNGSWLQDPRMERKGEQKHNVNMESK